MAAPMVCIPGQRICHHGDSHSAGRGTYERSGFIYSSLAGYLHTGVQDGGVTLVEVRREDGVNIVPAIDNIVTVRVNSVNPRYCKCSIISVERSSLREPFRAQIRKEDVRATEKDKVEMYKCFRPGDIVIGRVISLGDAYSYLLTTGENDLGVVVATSEAGAPMVPISWCEMQCPKTFAKEYRKVAKVQSQFIETDET